MSNCNTCSSNVIGPLTYTYSGFGTTSNSCGCAKSYCGCVSCDVDLVFDFGTTSLVKVDWSKILKKKGACKVMSSVWKLNKSASIPLSFDNQSFTDLTASIYISKGVYSGEYELINEITTERGDTLVQTVCIKLSGTDSQNATPIDQIEPCPIIDVKCDTSGMIFPGTFCKRDFCCDPFCKITFNLIEGCARVIDGGTYEINPNSPLVIDNSGQDLENFFIIVDCDSKVLYELELKD